MLQHFISHTSKEKQPQHVDTVFHLSVFVKYSKHSIKNLFAACIGLGQVVLGLWPD